MSDYSLMAINKNGEVVDAMTFADWVSTYEAIDTLRDGREDVIGILNSRTYEVVWQQTDIDLEVA